MLNPIVVILCDEDQYANGVRPREISNVLRRAGATVTVISSAEAMSDADSRRIGERWKLRFWRQLLRILNLIFVAQNRFPLLARGGLGTATVASLMKVRARLLQSYFSSRSSDLMISESPLNQLVFTRSRLATCQILDLPSPFGDELFYGGRLSRGGQRVINALERRAYESADHVGFHWHTYTQYLREHKYQGTNIIEGSYGVHPKNHRATFSPRPRLVYLGLLRGSWVNVPLLERLCALYEDIDIYGGPEPVGPLKKHYRGYAPDLDVLAGYQAGLVTISDDPLRRSSFSSKHLEYISYGLPVLTPEWRSDAILDPSSIFYSEDRFLEAVNVLRDPSMWEELSRASLEIASELSWDRALEPIIRAVNELE
jgi:hypothetical protein